MGNLQKYRIFKELCYIYEGITNLFINSFVSDRLRQKNIVLNSRCNARSPPQERESDHVVLVELAHTVRKLAQIIKG